MRFRIWDKEFKKMTYFRLSDIPIMKECFFCDDVTNDWVLLHSEGKTRIGRFVLMEGRFFISGVVAVYDYDVVLLDKKKYIVDWTSTGWELAHDTRLDKDCDDAQYIQYSDLEYGKKGRIELLGNIYENPELLDLQRK